MKKRTAKAFEHCLDNWLNGNCADAVQDLQRLHMPSLLVWIAQHDQGFEETGRVLPVFGEICRHAKRLAKESK